MIEKPLLYLYNINLVLQCVIDDYQEVSVVHDCFQAGDMTISINWNIPNAQNFQLFSFVRIMDELYVILKITDSIGEDGKASQMRVMTGKNIKYIFNQRIIKELNTVDGFQLTGAGETVMKTLIDWQCGSHAESYRRFKMLITDTRNAAGSEISINEKYTNLYTVLQNVAQQTETCWWLDFDGTSLALRFSNGEDRSSTVRFSTEFESLRNGTIDNSLESYTNQVYVSGKGEGAEVDFYAANVLLKSLLITESSTFLTTEKGEAFEIDFEPQNLELYESYSNESNMATTEEYAAKADAILKQYSQNVSVQGAGLAKSVYEYRRDYMEGDIITVKFSGQSAIARVLSVTEHWAKGVYDMSFTFGKPVNTLSNQLQIMCRNMQNLSRKGAKTDSVRWYTIPEDTAQTESETVYGTIGFTGGTPDTTESFQMYWNSNGTGAKTYHVYMKNYSGTLELAVQYDEAAYNFLRLEEGTYVAIIYIDDDGNIYKY